MPDKNNQVIHIVDIRDFPSQLTESILTLPSKAVKEVFREKMARTNFWLAEMRKLLDIWIEVDVNWHPMGFNDCGLISNSNESLGFCFYSKPVESNQFEINDISISILESKKVEISAVKNELLKANERFDKLLKEKGEELFSQVSRFFLFISLQLELNDKFIKHLAKIQNSASSKDIQESFPKFENLKNDLLKVFPNSNLESYFQYLPQPMTSYYGIEFVFDKPISEENFVEKLKSIIPNLQNGLLGWDLISKNAIEDTNCTIGIYPRHF
jgi:hypothetical protein